MNLFYSKRDWMFRVRVGFILAGLLGAALPAHARDFKVYPYSTPSEGEVELVYWWDYFVKSDKTHDYFGEVLDKEGLQRHSFEFEYGVTDRWTVSAYADFEKPKDGEFKYVQARAVVTRYRFFEQGERFLDGAIYVEYYLPYKKYRDGEKIETRVILEKEIGPISIILNPIFEKTISGPDVNEGMEFEYAAGLYYRAAPWLTPGVEFYGETGELSDLKPKDQQEHYIFPRLGFKFKHRMGLDVGYGFGLTEDSDDRVIKTILELEFP
jgi:hypothetical protein